MEKDKAECIYYIIQGKVAMIHKQTHTFVTDLKKEQYFGELGMLQEEPRCLTAKARDFTEVYIIKKVDFEHISENYIQALQAINKIREGLKREDYGPLKTRCYLCGGSNHISLKCVQYNLWKGNLMKIFQKQNKKPASSKVNINNSF